MAYRMCRTVIGPLSVAIVMLAASETFAQSVKAAAGVSVASPHSIFRAPFVGHHRRHHPGAFRPATGGFFYGMPTDERVADATQLIPGDVRYTYSYDVPWDWAHRFPPMVAPSDRPYVPSCPSETVTVPALNGQDRTVNIMRCY